MKKILALILAVALTASSLLVLASCGTCDHADSDGDGKCDECDAAFCESHKDTNHDNVCDTPGCDKFVKCQPHVDADYDNVCDGALCDAYVPCTTHRDADGDNVCDRPLCTHTTECKNHVDEDENKICDNEGCGFSLAVCDNHVDEDGDGVCDTEGCETKVSDGLLATLAAYANSLPTRIHTTSKWDFYEGKEAAYTLNGDYEIVTGKVNGLNATVEKVNYERLNKITDVETVQSVIEFVTTTDEYLQGYGRRQNAAQGNDWVSNGRNFAPRLGSIAINLEDVDLIDAKYVEGEFKNVFSFYINVDKIKTVFGSNIDITTNYKPSKGEYPKDSRVKVTITNDGAVVTGIKVEINIKAYDNDPAQKIVITTEYSYDVQVVNLIK